MRLLHTNELIVQSALNLIQPHHMPLAYMHGMMALLLFNDSPKSCVLLGTGGGDLLRYLHHYFPNSSVTAVEQDEMVIEIGKTYFQLPQTKNINIVIDDAGKYARQSHQQCDFLLVDIFGSNLPPLLNDNQFYKHCYQLLNANGMMAINLLTSDAQTLATIIWKIRQQFQQRTLCLTTPPYNNIVVLAFKQPPDLDKTILLQRAEILSKNYELDFVQMIENLFTNNPVIDERLCFNLEE